MNSEAAKVQKAREAYRAKDPPRCKMCDQPAELVDGKPDEYGPLAYWVPRHAEVCPTFQRDRQVNARIAARIGKVW